MDLITHLSEDKIQLQAGWFLCQISPRKGKAGANGEHEQVGWDLPHGIHPDEPELRRRPARLASYRMEQRCATRHAQHTHAGVSRCSRAKALLAGYVHYENLKPLVARIGLIRKEKDEAKNFEVRQSSLADAEEALWLAVEQQIDKADSYYQSLIESLQHQSEYVTLEMRKVKNLQEFLVARGLQVGDVDGFYGPLTISALREHVDSGQTQEAPEASPDSLDVVADFCSTLGHLQEFILINYVVLAKLCKYYVERAGLGTDFERRLHAKLPATQLYTTPGLLDLMCQAEALVAGDVSIGKARVVQGDAWIKSRLTHSRIMTLARQASADAHICPHLPFLEASQSSAPGETDRASTSMDDSLTTPPASPGTWREASSPEEAKRRVLQNAMGASAEKSKTAREVCDRRLQMVRERSVQWDTPDEGADGGLFRQEAPQAAPKIFKVALTGGPCAGKTSSLSAIADYFKGLGWRVYVVREAASVMLSGGINFAYMNGEQIFELQTAIVKLMMTLEDSYAAICAKGAPDEKCLILCDRGIMDASVYCDTDTWQRVMGHVGLDAASACDARYTGVVHLVTAADGAEEHYNLDSNSEGVRTETAEQARELDKKTGAAWASHPSLSVIDNSSDFNKKVKRGLAAICGFVGENAPNFALRRRKYLVSSANLRTAGLLVKTSDCDYAYLISSDNKQHRLRRRIADGTILYTHIRRSIQDNGSVMDLKDNIDRARYLAMLSYQDPQRMLIRVVRETFVYKNRQFCLNHVFGMQPQLQADGAPALTRSLTPRAKGSVMLLSVWCEDAAEIDLPPADALCVEKEVTGLMEYSLFYLSQISEDAVTSAPSSPAKKMRAPPAEGLPTSPLDLD